MQAYPGAACPAGKVLSAEMSAAAGGLNVHTYYVTQGRIRFGDEGWVSAGGFRAFVPTTATAPRKQIPCAGVSSSSGPRAPPASAYCTTRLAGTTRSFAGLGRRTDEHTRHGESETTANHDYSLTWLVLLQRRRRHGKCARASRPGSAAPTKRVICTGRPASHRSIIA